MKGYKEDDEGKIEEWDAPILEEEEDDGTPPPKNVDYSLEDFDSEGEVIYSEKLSEAN